jgi:DNA-binding NtrC family response regulator
MTDKAHILVIDDDDMIRDGIRDILVRAGYLVTGAANGEQGLEALASQPFDVVITDILMPEKEGVETIIEIRKALPDTPIIAMSGGGRVKNMYPLKIATKIGATKSLAKPFDAKDLLKLVQEVAPHPSKAVPA